LSFFYEADGKHIEHEIHVRFIVDSNVGTELEHRTAVNNHITAGFGNRLVVNPLRLVGYFMRFPTSRLVFLNIKYYLLQKGYAEQEIQTSTTGYHYIKLREGQGNSAKAHDYISYCTNRFLIQAGALTGRFISLSRFEFLQVGKGDMFRESIPEIAIDAELKRGSWIKIFNNFGNQNDIEEIDIFVTQVYGKRMWRKKVEQKEEGDQMQLERYLEEMIRNIKGMWVSPPKSIRYRREEPKETVENYILDDGQPVAGEIVNVIFLYSELTAQLNIKRSRLKEETLDMALQSLFFPMEEDLIPQSINLGTEMVKKTDSENGTSYRYYKVLKVETEPIDFRDDKYLEFPPKYF
jgi:hypothetical protein